MRIFLRLLSLMLSIVIIAGCLSACNGIDGDDIKETKKKVETKKESKDTKKTENTKGSKETEITEETEETEATEAIVESESTEATEATQESEETEESESSTTKKPSTTQNLSRIFTRDLKNYKFVVSANASEEIKQKAKRVCEAAAAKWDCEAELKNDDYAYPTEEKYEILIGATNRTESTKYKTSLKIGEGGYALNKTKITILGYSDEETLSALEQFYFNYVLAEAKSSMFFTDNDNFKAKLSEYVSIMTFNLYVYIESDEAKKANAIKLIRDYSPDIFGVQEESAKWQTTMKAEFSKDYHIIGVGRDANGSGEAMQIFAKKSKFNVKSSGTKWLSSTPNSVSKVAESACNRIVTYAVLERISDGKIFNYANTHLDHVGGQEEQVKYLAQIIDNNMQSGAPTFVTGDFNADPSSNAFKTMTSQGYTPSFDLAESSSGKNVPTLNSAIIDYIFVKNDTGVKTKFYRVCNEKDYGQSSDHYPVFSIFQFK